MSDLFPERPRTSTYTPAFEACWRVHKVGNKKAAYKAGKNAGFRQENWAWLTQYLEQRHKDDAKWIEGKYIPHLSSIINQERWDDPYEKVKPQVDRYDKANDENPNIELTDAQRQKAREAMHRGLASLRVVGD